MKKLFVLATAAFLVTGIAFAHDGDKKKCDGKDCCKKDAKGKDCCKKETKTTTATAKPATKPAAKTTKS